ncbi:MAG: sulfatase-like hydrolase/transferase [Chloroflexaceae bacterium]|nr:sulfatase-like hydrolase/transferase [Chloroflexaceae bacterium]
MPKLLIIGLDCAEPSLVFERWLHDLPNLARLMRQGTYGLLESCIPAITVPAWSCMMSGRDPGELGIYGFRNRSNRSYQSMTIANSQAVRVPRLWNLLSDAGWQCAVIGVPGTYPPQPLNGAMVSCFLAPSTSAEYTYPPGLAAQVRAWVGNYLLDVPDFRSDDKERILRDIYTLGDQRFLVAERLLEQNHPDMLMLVEMGVDRLHHAFWRHMDPTHPLHVPDSPFAQAIHDYYVHVDQHIGRLMAYGDDQTVVLVVSDHGARPLMGGVCINDWLRAEGYLTLRELPPVPVPLEQAQVDWGRTRAWGAGGYYGRIFLNVQGREPEGVIPIPAYEQERQALAEKLRAMPGPDGHPLGNRVFTPQHIYRRVRGIAPDLVVYFGDLAWRSVGKVGMETLYPLENDTGPDDANHAQHGLFILHDPQRPGGGQRLEGVQLYDILPTLLARYGITPPDGLRGRVIAGEW